MCKELQSIYKVVWQARKNFEQRTIPVEKLGELYFTYNPEVEPPSFVEKARHLFPHLNCGLTSVYLRSILGGKITRGRYQNHDHTFLLWRHLVVDITADQFGGPKVYVGKLMSPWKIGNDREITLLEKLLQTA
jgi:hypothetical protein